MTEIRKSMKTALLARGAKSHEETRRARFQSLLDRSRRALDAMQSEHELYTNGVRDDFSEMVDLAKRELRMSKAEFEAAVACLNTPFSRVFDRCPAERDTRDVTEFMRMTPEELRMSYDLQTPRHATEWITHHGAAAGYTAAQIAKARSEYNRLDALRRARIENEDNERAKQERARFDARLRAGYSVWITRQA